MSDSDNEDYNNKEEENANEQAAQKKARPKPIPLVVQYMNNNAPAAKILSLVKQSVETYAEDSEAPPIEESTSDDTDEPLSEEEAQKLENEKVYSLSQLSHFKDSQGRNLFQWAVDHGRFLLVENFIKYGLRLTGLTTGSGDATLDQALEINEKWTAERQRIEDELIEKLKSEDEEEEEEEEEEEPAADDEAPEPEPDFAQTMADEMEIPVQRVRRIGDLGVYIGSYSEDGLKHGYGVSLYPNGDIYVGQYDRGTKHGRGAYIYKMKRNKKNIAQAFYCGDWQHNVKCGKGYQLYPNGNRYHGAWNDNQMDGNGKMTYVNGDFYVGEFKSGVKCGQGEYNFHTDKSKYVGRFENGIMREGVWDCNAFVYEGQFDSKGLPGIDDHDPKPGVLQFRKSLVSQRGVFSKEHEFKVMGDVEDLIDK